MLLTKVTVTTWSFDENDADELVDLIRMSLTKVSFPHSNSPQGPTDGHRFQSARTDTRAPGLALSRSADAHRRDIRRPLRGSRIR